MKREVFIFSIFILSSVLVGEYYLSKKSYVYGIEFQVSLPRFVNSMLGSEIWNSDLLVDVSLKEFDEDLEYFIKESPYTKKESRYIVRNTNRSYIINLKQFVNSDLQKHLVKNIVEQGSIFCENSMLVH